MKPYNSFYLRAIVQSLTSEIAPQIESKYHKSILCQIIQLLSGIAEDVDQSASRLIEGNQEIRSLLADASAFVEDEDLKTELEKITKTSEDNYTVSALSDINHRLLEVLIKLHTHVETLNSDESTQIETSIWNLLAMRFMRRVPAISKSTEAIPIN
jgi:hypothetical protein